MAVQLYVCFHPESLVFLFDSFSCETNVLIQNDIYLCFESGENCVNAVTKQRTSPTG